MAAGRCCPVLNAAARIISLLLLLALLLTTASTLSDGLESGHGDTPPCEPASVKCPQLSKVVVMLRWTKQSQFAGYYAAQELGYYADSCLDVTLVHRESVNYSPEAEVNALNAQVAMPWAMDALRMREQGLKLINIAQLFTRSGGRHFVNPHANITHYNDLLKRDRTIIRTDRDDYGILNFIQTHNLPACGEIIEKECRPGDRIEVKWRGHNVDWFNAAPGDPEYGDMGFGMIYNQKALMLMTVRQGKLVHSEESLVELNPADILGTTPSEDGIYVQADWLKEPANYDTARRFVKSTFKGFIYCRDYETRCVDIVVEGNDDPTLRLHEEWMMHETNKLIWPAPNGLGRHDKANMEGLIALAKNLSILPTDTSITAGDIQNYALVEPVLAELRRDGLDTIGGVFSHEYRSSSLRFCLSPSGSITYCKKLSDVAGVSWSSTTVIIVAIICVAFTLLLLLLLCRYRSRIRRARSNVDKMWQIPIDHLTISNEILGYGSSGLVVKGEYRGTTVAIKRGLPGGVAQYPQFMCASGTDHSMCSNPERHNKSECCGSGTDKEMRPAASSTIVFPKQSLNSSAGVGKTVSFPGVFSSSSTCSSSDTTEAGVSRWPRESSSEYLRKSLDRHKLSSSLGSLVQRLTPAQRKSEEARLEAVAAMAALESPSVDSGGPPVASSRVAWHARAQMRCKRVFGALDELRGRRKDEMAGSDDSVGMDSIPRVPSGEQTARRSANTRQRLLTTLRAFEEEVRLVVHLRHPNITTVMGAVVGDDPLLVMECMEHGSLRELLLNETFVLEPQIMLSLLRDVASGMKFLHMANPPIVHNDIKASNILVDRNMRAKVADFGLSTNRKAGIIAGTPAFIAPEVLRGGQPTTASDVYSFAITMFEVIAREEAYAGDDPLTVMREVADPLINGMRRPKLTHRVPRPLANLMLKCWDDDPDARPTFNDILNELKMIEESSETEEWKLYSQHNLLDRVDGQSSDDLLHQILPRHIADALKAGEKVEPESFRSVTIFFSDIVGFTNICSTLKPREVMDMLDRLYHCFDDITKEHGLFKVETIGDAYMVVGGLHTRQPDHAGRVARFALAVTQAANQVPISLKRPELGNISIRAGFHTGPVVASVVGNLNPRYCLFGDTVNTSSRMESTSQANCVQCSAKSARRISLLDPGVVLESRGVINVKGKHTMETFWVRGTTSPAPICSPFAEESSDDIEMDVRNSKRDSCVSIVMDTIADEAPSSGLTDHKDGVHGVMHTLPEPSTIDTFL